MIEVIERCNWLVNKCEDKAITPDVKDDVRYLLEEIERLNKDLGDMTKLFAKEKERNRQAIEYIEYYFAKGRTKNHKQFDLSLYEILTGKNLFNLTMKEIEQFFKGADKE